MLLEQASANPSLSSPPSTPPTTSSSANAAGSEAAKAQAALDSPVIKIRKNQCGTFDLGAGACMGASASLSRRRVPFLCSLVFRFSRP
jgi:hypothetical protein